MAVTSNLRSTLPALLPEPVPTPLPIHPPTQLVIKDLLVPAQFQMLIKQDKEQDPVSQQLTL